MLLQMALFHSFNGWVLFYCVCRIYTYIHTCIPHLLYTFICRWTFSLCPCRSSGHSLSHVWLFVAPWLQDTRLPSPSTTPGTCSNSHPLSQWCHPTISSSVIPFSSCLQSVSASGSFPMSQFFASGNQIIGASASTSVLPMHIQDWFPLGWTCLISLQSKGLSRVFSNTTVQKDQF